MCVCLCCSMWGLTRSCLLPFKSLPDHSFVPPYFPPRSLPPSFAPFLSPSVASSEREVDIWHLFDWKWIVDIPSGTRKRISGIFSVHCASGGRKEEVWIEEEITKAQLAHLLLKCLPKLSVIPDQRERGRKTEQGERGCQKRMKNRECERITHWEKEGKWSHKERGRPTSSLVKLTGCCQKAYCLVSIWVIDRFKLFSSSSIHFDSVSCLNVHPLIK